MDDPEIPEIGLSWTAILVQVTVVAIVKVFDGIVISADSATTMQFPNGSAQVYNNANKVFHLHRDFPIAAATWGLGGLGAASISTLMKDFRQRLMGIDHGFEGWKLEPDYTIQGVAERIVQMLFDEFYVPQVGSGRTPQVELGMAVAGYQRRNGIVEGEVWTIKMLDTLQRPVPQLAAGADQMGWLAYAIEGATDRLFRGYDDQLVNILQTTLDPQAFGAVMGRLGELDRQPALAAMPVGDAIKLAEYMAEVTAGWAHFLPGPDVVGGEIEVASITRHEGFKWIRRKHYYPQELNPEDPGHDHWHA
ncbi:MAG: hypothetical protein M0Z92_14575 [Actinomycetota bacterium]|nr:hypothetical protein [Actinomycetota bacterium]